MENKLVDIARLERNYDVLHAMQSDIEGKIHCYAMLKNLVYRITPVYVTPSKNSWCPESDQYVKLYLMH